MSASEGKKYFIRVKGEKLPNTVFFLEENKIKVQKRRRRDKRKLEKDLQKQIKDLIDNIAINNIANEQVKIIWNHQSEVGDGPKPQYWMMYSNGKVKCGPLGKVYK